MAVNFSSLFAFVVLLEAAVLTTMIHGQPFPTEFCRCALPGESPSQLSNNAQAPLQFGDTIFHFPPNRIPDYWVENGVTVLSRATERCFPSDNIFSFLRRGGGRLRRMQAKAAISTENEELATEKGSPVFRSESSGKKKYTPQSWPGTTETEAEDFSASEEATDRWLKGKKGGKGKKYKGKKGSADDGGDPEGDDPDDGAGPDGRSNIFPCPTVAPSETSSPTTIAPETLHPSTTPTLDAPSGAPSDPAPSSPPSSFPTLGQSDASRLRTCVAIIDENDGSFPDAYFDEQWALFRSAYPDRNFCLVNVESDRGLYVPPALIADNLTVVTNVVPYDDGDPALATDWFDLCNLADIPESIPGVAVFVDTSSLDRPRFTASFDLFYARVEEAGLDIIERRNQREDYITPFIADLI